MNIYQSDSADSELSGYLELGMTAEAEELALRHLKEQKVSPATFNEAMDAVLVSMNSRGGEPISRQHIAT